MHQKVCPKRLRTEDFLSSSRGSPELALTQLACNGCSGHILHIYTSSTSRYLHIIYIYTPSTLDCPVQDVKMLSRTMLSPLLLLLACTRWTSSDFITAPSAPRLRPQSCRGTLKAYQVKISPFILVIPNLQLCTYNQLEKLEAAKAA